MADPIENPPAAGPTPPATDLLPRLVGVFLNSKLSLIFILLAVLLGAAALTLTPREENPQILVPMIDIYVHFPGHSAKSVEQLVTTPLERLVYQIHGVQYVYSTSQRGQAIVTARFFVGQDVQRSVMKVYRKLNKHLNLVPPGVAGWAVKPETINNVPIVTLTLTSKTATPTALSDTAQELLSRLSAIPEVSRAYLVGGRPRVVHVYMNAAKMQAFHVTAVTIQQAIEAANVSISAGSFKHNNQEFQVLAGNPLGNSRELGRLVVGVWRQQPVFLRSVARVIDGAAEADCYVAHYWGPAAHFPEAVGFRGDLIAGTTKATVGPGQPAISIAVAKKAGANAVSMADAVISCAKSLAPAIIPADMQLVVTRNYGLASNEKVNTLVFGLLVAIAIVVALLTIGLGWRESLVVAVAIPVVFGITLAVNLLLGYTINRVTLFALILSLGLLVDDPIVDVENISRHFAMAGKATRRIALGAVTEILQPLIVATFAVILSFVPMFFITGMMGPYMRPMALNVPVAMLASLLVAVTITPWLRFHVLKHKWKINNQQTLLEEADPHAVRAVKKTLRYRIFNPLLGPLLRHRPLQWLFLAAVGCVTILAVMLPAERLVPLKMLPFDNGTGLLLVVHEPRGTTLEQTSAAAQALGRYLQTQPEVVDFTSYTGAAAPMDFNGLVRHYFLRNNPNDAQIAIDLAGKDRRVMQSHDIALRMRNALTAIARKYGARLAIVESPPGPPVLDSIVAEVTGAPGVPYRELQAAADTVRRRLMLEPDVVDTDTSVQAPEQRRVFTIDREKAALDGITAADIARTLQIALHGAKAGLIHAPRRRAPLTILLRLPIAARSSTTMLDRLNVAGTGGQEIPLMELGHWKHTDVGQTIYHKNLHKLVYVYADTAGRPPVNAVADVLADQLPDAAEPATTGMTQVAGGWIRRVPARPLSQRSFFHNGSGIAWQLRPGIHVNFAGEGELRITEHVFRDLGIAFAAAMIGIYVLLVAQTGAFLLPLVIMLAIPLTIPGVMPGFFLLNHIDPTTAGGYASPVFFTATAMIGMIALSGIVTRNSIILIDFIHRSLARSLPLHDAILESCVVRLRPILLTAAAAMFSSIPILTDPVFSGLAWALIFGLFASTFFTLFVVPVTYWMLFNNKPGHGLPMPADD